LRDNYAPCGGAAGLQQHAVGPNLVQGIIEIENVHPVEGGVFRLKFRRCRRSTMPMEPAWTFYPKYLAESLSKIWQWGKLYTRLRRIYVRIKYDPKRWEYTDAAITPVTDDEIETHEMFQNQAARNYVDQERRVEKIIYGTAA
jgi:hypothetical protein